MIEICALVGFLLDIVSIETYVKTASEHLPNLFKSMVAVLTNKAKDLTRFEVTQALELANWREKSVDISQCGIFRISLSFKFSVKSNLENVD